MLVAALSWSTSQAQETERDRALDSYLLNMVTRIDSVFTTGDTLTVIDYDTANGRRAIVVRPSSSVADEFCFIETDSVDNLYVFQTSEGNPDGFRVEVDDTSAAIQLFQKTSSGLQPLEHASGLNGTDSEKVKRVTENLYTMFKELIRENYVYVKGKKLLLYWRHKKEKKQQKGTGVRYG